MRIAICVQADEAAQVLARFRTELPMTVTGKPQKFLMREAMIEELGLVVQKTA